MNIKQKMIEAGYDAMRRSEWEVDVEAAIDAALAVLVERSCNSFDFSDYFSAENRTHRDVFNAVINHIRSLP